MLAKSLRSSSQPMSMHPDHVKVLLISSNSSPMGGGERYLYYLARGFLLNHCSCSTLYSNLPYMDAWSRLLSQAGSSVIRKPLRPLANRKLRFISAILDLPQIIGIALTIRDLSPSLVIINRQYDEDNLDAVIAALIIGSCNVLSVVHMPMTHSKNLRPLGRLRGVIMNLFLGLFRHHHVFSSQAGLNEFSSYYRSFSTKYLHVIPSGIFEYSDLQTELRPQARSGSKFNNNLPCIGFMGQFNEQKNIFLLIDAWKLSNHNFNLVLVGKGPLESQIRHYIEECNSPRYCILPWSDEYRTYLASLDLFVMTSVFEGLPLTLIEALGLGIPAIVTPFNGSKELTANCNWLKVCKDFSIDSFSWELEQYLSGTWRPKPDASELKAFRSDFSVMKMSQGYSDLLEIS